MARQNKKLVATSIISVALCGALLAGSSFAWFTDKVTNEGNTIESGTLKIQVTDGDGKDLEALEEGFITAENVEPGWSDKAELKITNVGSLATDVKLTFTLAEGDNELLPVMWYSVDGGATKLPMADITGISSQELKLVPKSETDGTVGSKYSDQYTFTYGMYEEAGNEYQNKSFSMDLSIDAKQSTFEVDGFGSNQYDKDATYINAGQVNLPSKVLEDLAKVETTKEKKDILVEAGVVSGNTSNAYVDMIAEGKFNIEKGLTLSQGSEASVDMLSSYPKGSTIDMTPKDGATNNITINEQGKLVLKISNSTGVHTYDVEVKDSKGNVIDSYVAKFVSVNFYGNDPYNINDLVVGNNNITTSRTSGKQISDYDKIKDEIVSITGFTYDTEYLKINDCNLQDGGAINFDFEVLKEIDKAVRLRATVELKDGSKHSMIIFKLQARNMG